MADSASFLLRCHEPRSLKPNSHASCSDKSGTSPTITCESGLVLNGMETPWPLTVLGGISNVSPICLFTPGLISWVGFHSKDKFVCLSFYFSSRLQCSAFLPPFFWRAESTEWNGARSCGCSWRDRSCILIHGDSRHRTGSWGFFGCLVVSS